MLPLLWYKPISKMVSLQPSYPSPGNGGTYLSVESVLDRSRTHGRHSSKASLSIPSCGEASGDLTLPIGQWAVLPILASAIGSLFAHIYTPLLSMSALSVEKVIFWSPLALSFAYFFLGEFRKR